MDTPPMERGLAVTFSWTSGGQRRQASVSFGPALRVALALSLCAGCYEVGQWRARLELNEAKPDSRVVVVERGDKGVRNETAGLAPGGAIGEKDVITPLNVRDPSALVMGPSQAAPSPPQAAPQSDIPEASPPERIYKNPKDIQPNRRF